MHLGGGFSVVVRQTGAMEAVDWALRDRRTGHIVVAQWPNTALVVWMAASVVRAVFEPVGTWGLALRVVATVALSWWAADEVVRGVNPWRRLLGAVVFAGLAVSLLR
jgi:hypothetical protein